MAPLRRLACAAMCLAFVASAACGQEFRYAAAKVGEDPAPRMMLPSPDFATMGAGQPRPLSRFSQRLAAGRARYAPYAQGSGTGSGILRTSGAAYSDPGATSYASPASTTAATSYSGGMVEPFVEDLPVDVPLDAPMEQTGDVVYENYGGDPPPLMEPQVMSSQPFLDETSPACVACEQPYGGGGRIRRGWNQMRCLAAHGAYCENLSVFTGKQAFKSPVDQGINGDFGYQIGGNWGMPLIDSLGIGYQVGADFLVSDLEGRSGVMGHRRTQFFFTTGVFHRVVGDRGFQGGAVFDYLRDNFYINMNLSQVRTQVSYYLNGHDVGFWGAFQTNTSTQWATTTFAPYLAQYSFQANSQFNAFYRYQFCNGTYMRGWAGLTGHGDGILGSDATIHISPRMGLVASFNHLIPRNDPTINNNVKESWNLTINLVFYPGYKRCDSWQNPYRPLFYTADNGWFLVRKAN